jgi:hypothetical protein
MSHISAGLNGLFSREYLALIFVRIVVNLMFAKVELLRKIQNKTAEPSFFVV